MSPLSPLHIDEFMLLRYTAGDLPVLERERVTRHLKACGACSVVRDEIGKLDLLLHSAARAGEIASEPAEGELPPGDPFRSRPDFMGTPRAAGEGLREAALDAAGSSLSLKTEIQAALPDAAARKSVLDGMSLARAADRFALLYALQEAGPRIAENPAATMNLAEEVLSRLRRRDASKEAAEPGAERMVPRLFLFAQAHQLAGQACNWTSEFHRAGSHLEIAYRSFGRATNDEVSLATVELLESQRRFFLDRPQEALVLARRCGETFEELGVQDARARSHVAEGIALFSLGHHEPALALFRQAYLVFEKLGLWSNSINCLNNIGACLQKVGRLDDARREYARALRRFSREHHRSLAFIRHGLAEVLFAASRYREAALSLSQAVRLYSELGLPARALTASLLEIESWARSGDTDRARRRLEILQADIARHPGLDPVVSRQIHDALSGHQPDFERVAGLRRETQQALRRRDWQASA